MIEIRDDLDNVIDRGYGWKEPGRGWVIDSKLDGEEKVYDFATMGYDSVSIAELGPESSEYLNKIYDVMNSDLLFTLEDKKYIHLSDIVTRQMVLELKLLRELDYDGITSLKDIKDLDEFIEKFYSFVDKKHQESIDKIQELISNEEDAVVKSEYELVLTDLDDSVKDFKKVTKEKIKNPHDVAYHWPTLLNPSPFHTFRSLLY